MSENTENNVVAEAILDTEVSVEVPATLTKKALKAGEYIPAIGRRKTATATVRIKPAKETSITVNDKPYTQYFSLPALQKSVMGPFHKLKLVDQFEVTVHVSGSGIAAQAEAVRHGISRALTEFAPELRSPLKKSGYLKRDPRSKERRKPGLKKARKASQWSKR
jgi:small subunit ribosomal protein S9